MFVVLLVIFFGGVMTNGRIYSNENKGGERSPLGDIVCWCKEANSASSAENEASDSQ